MTITTRSFWLTVHEDNGHVGVTLSEIDKHYQRGKSITIQSATSDEVKRWLQQQLGRVIGGERIEFSEEKPK